MNSKKGLTLIELAIVLVIIGLLVGAGASLMGILVKRIKYNETKEKINGAVEAILSHVTSVGRLPNSTEFNSLVPSRRDAYNRDMLYIYDSALDTGNICGYTSTSISINVCPDTSCSSPIQTINNVAFIIVSGGENRNIQTGNAGTINVYEQGVQNVDDYPTDISRAEEYDDILKWVTLNELKSARKCEGLVITSPTTLSPAEEDSGYSYKLEAKGGVPPYSWSGSVGSGLSISSNGIISGVVNTNSGSTGTVSGCSTSINFSATVSDSAGQSVTGSFTIPVNARAVEIITNSLPIASEGSSYSASISSIGGDGNYSYSIVSGSLPPGLTLNPSTGEISGTVSISDAGCSESGNVYNFVVQVSSCTTAVKGFSITVRDPDCYTSGGGGGGSGGGGGGGGGGSGSTATITINNPNGVNLTNFQVRVDLSVAVGCLGSIFTIKDGSTPVSFCLERSSGECTPVVGLWDTSSVWIRVPSLPAGGTKTLTVEQSSSTGATSGVNVFELYDDFNDGDVSDWAVVNGVITPDTLGTDIVLRLQPNFFTNFKHITYPTTQSFSLTEYIVEARIRDVNPAGGVMFHYVNDDNWWGLEHYVGGNRDIFRPFIGGIDRGWVYTRSPVSILNNAWYRVKVEAFPDRFKMYINNSLVWTLPIAPAYRLSGYTKVGFVEHRFYGPLYADWIRVRKFALLEPSATVSCP